VECDRRYATNIKCLMQFAKKNKLVSEMWGKHAHVSEVVNKDSTPSMGMPGCLNLPQTMPWKVRFLLWK
jgi:hypothetical protein